MPEPSAANLDGIAGARRASAICPRPARHVVWAALLVGVSACAGDQHRSDGRYEFTMTGGLEARVDGAAHAQYAHRFSSSGQGFTLGLRIPAGRGVFPRGLPGAIPDPVGPQGDTDTGQLVFYLDSLPTPGTYTPGRATTPPPGVRAERTVGVLLMSSSAAHLWYPVGGAVRFARTPGTRDGLRAAFRLTLFRSQGGPQDTAVVTGSLETR
jgi:hypothetical protein